MTDPINPVPIVQCAFTAANSIRLAASYHHAVKGHGKQALAEARKAGEALLRAKAECPHGEWLALLEQTWPRSRQTAQRYMRIANNWEVVDGAETIDEALRWLVENVEEEEVTADSKSSAPSFLPKTGGGQSSTGSAGQPGERAGSGSKRTPGTATSPPPVQPTLDFTGESAVLKRTQAAIARKKKLAEEAHAALGQLLEVLPELSTGTMGAEFAELATAAGLGPVPQKSEKGEFVGPKLVATETFTDRFPPLEALREATAAFLKKFGEAA